MLFLQKGKLGFSTLALNLRLKIMFSSKGKFKLTTRMLAYFTLEVWKALYDYKMESETGDRSFIYIDAGNRRAQEGAVL